MPDLETLSDRLLRSAAARWIGLVIGVLALGFLVRTLATEGEQALAWVRSITPIGMAAFVAGFALYHLGAVLTLRPLLWSNQPALPIWTAAQVIKYLPVPGSAVVGMVGSTVRRGGSTRQGLGLILRHSVLHIGAATAMGSPAVAGVAARVGVPAAVTIPVVVAAGLGLAWVAVRSLARTTAIVVIGLAGASWAVLGTLLAVGFDTGGAWLLVAAAYPAGWVAGQLVVPVPAGIGVRETVLLVLLGPVIGEVGAVTFAVGTRLLHVVSDGVLAAVSSTREGMTRLATDGEGDQPPNPGGDPT